jgi:hypothetical protein
MDEIDPKAKTWGLALGIVIFGLVMVDFVVLKGERVASGSVSLRSSSTAAVLSISRPGETHLVEISTLRRVKGETRGQSISYRFEAPDGKIVAEDSELISHKKRFFEFVPTQTGEYRLHAEETTLLGSGHGTASVRVSVGDRRILSRLLRF